jgi:hypothetical protein
MCKTSGVPERSWNRRVLGTGGHSPTPVGDAGTRSAIVCHGPGVSSVIWTGRPPRIGGTPGTARQCEPRTDPHEEHP